VVPPKTKEVRARDVRLRNPESGVRIKPQPRSRRCRGGRIRVRVPSRASGP
jgi:hypothetical protein